MRSAGCIPSSQVSLQLLFFSLSEFEHFLKETIFKTTALKGDASFRTSNGPENKTLAEVLSSFLWRSFGEAGRGREGEVGRDGGGIGKE